jgi:adenylosuccinate synthase
MKATVVVDLGFGDAGKGKVVDFLCRQQRGALVVRYCGGPQAAHNVVTWDGKHHTFSQFGAGTLAGSSTYLSKFMMVNPLNAFKEAEHLRSVGVKDPFSMLHVDTRAMVLTPAHKSLNRLRELSRGIDRHGSTGEGVGEGRIHQSHSGWESVLRVGHLTDRVLSQVMLERFLRYAKDAVGEFEVPRTVDKDMWGQAMENILYPKMKEWLDAYADFGNVVQIEAGNPLRNYENIVFEGAQGVLLDEQFGFHPYTTWSKTTRHNALELLSGTGTRRNVTVLGVIRSYTTRHGPGPMVTEDFHMTRDIPELHNGAGVWQGAWRNGHLDLPVLQYAITASDVDGLAVTHMDRVPDEGMPICTSYDAPSGVVPGDYYLGGRDTTLLMKDFLPVLTNVSKSAYLDMIEHHLSRPVVLTSYGPTAHETRVLQRSFFKEEGNEKLVSASA